MLLGKVFERFVEGSPLSVMLRGTLAFALQPALLEQLFCETARQQYTHQLLFSTLVDLTSLVVCRIHRSHGLDHPSGQFLLPRSAEGAGGVG